MIGKFDSIVFALLGNFITACHSKNWAWADLLRSPAKFYGVFQQNKFLAFRCPAWIPYEDAILKIPPVGIEAKLKDLGLPSHVQKSGESEIILVVDVEDLVVGGVQSLQGQLVYWPMFRFLIEPMSYSDEVEPAKYVLMSLDYIMRASGIAINLDVSRMTLKSSQFTLQVGGTSTFDSLILTEPDSVSFWSLPDRIISLAGPRFKIFNSALESMLSSGVSLERCEFRRINEGLELRYVG